MPGRCRRLSDTNVFPLLAGGLHRNSDTERSQVKQRTKRDYTNKNNTKTPSTEIIDTKKLFHLTVLSCDFFQTNLK
jgi:hypothetical protein